MPMNIILKPLKVVCSTIVTNIVLIYLAHSLAYAVLFNAQVGFLGPIIFGVVNGLFLGIFSKHLNEQLRTILIVGPLSGFFLTGGLLMAVAALNRILGNIDEPFDVGLVWMSVYFGAVSSCANTSTLLIRRLYSD